MSDIQMILDQLGLEKGTQERREVEHALRKRLREKIIELRSGSMDAAGETLMHNRAKLAAKSKIAATDKFDLNGPSLVFKSGTRSPSAGTNSRNAIVEKRQPLEIAAKGLDRKQERETAIPAVVIANNHLIAMGRLDLERSGRVFLTVDGDIVPDGLLIDGSKAQIDGIDYFIKAGASAVAIEALAKFRVPRIFEVKGLKWRKAKSAFRVASNRGEDRVSIAIGK